MSQVIVLADAHYAIDSTFALPCAAITAERVHRGVVRFRNFDDWWHIGSDFVNTLIFIHVSCHFDEDPITNPLLPVLQVSLFGSTVETTPRDLLSKHHSVCGTGMYPDLLRQCCALPFPSLGACAATLYDSPSFLAYWLGHLKSEGVDVIVVYATQFLNEEDMELLRYMEQQRKAVVVDWLVRDTERRWAQSQTTAMWDCYERLKGIGISYALFFDSDEYIVDGVEEDLQSKKRWDVPAAKLIPPPYFEMEQWPRFSTLKQFTHDVLHPRPTLSGVRFFSWFYNPDLCFDTRRERCPYAASAWKSKEVSSRWF